MNPASLKFRPTALVLFWLCALFHLLIVVFNHYQFRTFAYYYGVYNFAFYDFAHFKVSPNPVLFDGTGATFLQDHFSLLLPLLSPLYWILNPLIGTYSLLVLQWIAVIYGGWTTYRLIEWKSGGVFLPTCAMVCYFFFYCRLVSYNADCNLAIIGSALIPPFLYNFEKNSRSVLLLIFSILLTTREDFSLWLFFICIYLAIQHRGDPQKRKMAFMMMAGSLIFFLLTMTVFIPALETPNAKFMLFNYNALGSNSLESARFILMHPLESTKWLFTNHLNDARYDGVKLRYYTLFLCSGGILLFLRPATLICLLPLVAKKMYNDDPDRWDIESYYGIETASVLPVLIFTVIAGLSNERRKLVTGSLVLLATLLTTAWHMEHAPGWFADTKLRFYKPRYWTRDLPAREYHQALRLIPPGASVSASGKLLPHLAYRQNIFYFPLVKDADFVCVTEGAEGWPKTAEEYNTQVEKLITSPAWKLIYNKNDLIILRRTVFQDY